MAAAAQLHGSAAATAAYRWNRASSVPSSCRWPQGLLAGTPKVCLAITLSGWVNVLFSPQLSITTSGGCIKPFGFAAKLSTKCANENPQVESDLQLDQMKELQVEEHVIPQKRSARIHDFCLGIPFGGLLFSMGLLGYIFSRSTISLVLGIAPGLATLLLGTLSLKFWRSGRSSFLLILAQAAISAFLAWKYSHAYLLTNRLLPWGFYASLSTAMGCFYAYVLLAGGNPPPKRLAAIPPQ